MTEFLSGLDQHSLLIGMACGFAVCALFALYWVRSNAQKWQQQESTLNSHLELKQTEQTLLAEQNEKLLQQVNALQQEQHHLDLQKTRLDERLNNLEPLLTQAASDRTNLEKKLEQTAFQLADRNEVVAELEARLETERSSHNEKLKTLEQAREQLKQEFQNLANRIFDEKSKRFSENSKENLGHLLNPLRDQLGDFKRRVEDVYDKEAKDRRALHEQIGHLKQLNQQMSEDAINLTSALKGENKTQGNWGEVVLERALEESGLRKGHEFELQVSVSQEGKRYQPDAIIRLPDGKDIIVDSKVSLTAYEQYCSTDDEAEKERFLREHILSVRGHIKGLSDKAYETLEGIRSLDFVLLFIPVEGAFLLALEREATLFKEAFDRNIMLVSPATLMVTLRTIHNIWRYEHQNQNAKEIAKRGGELHDKFVGFVESVEEIGKNLNRTQQSFETAHKRLVSGRGNLVNQVAMLQKLGADSKKKIAQDLLEKAAETDQ
ncbi:DNA recombination protein RmuC [Neptuniibacter sp.]|uniref:DNA recombination protein RmuC n=1 Tax=Neptuniibacter sp. TaxID=1962643 RepID=UPI003B5AE801